jgi:hypothetical protein
MGCGGWNLGALTAALALASWCEVGIVAAASHSADRAAQGEPRIRTAWQYRRGGRLGKGTGSGRAGDGCGAEALNGLPGECSSLGEDSAAWQLQGGGEPPPGAGLPPAYAHVVWVPRSPRWRWRRSGGPGGAGGQMHHPCDPAARRGLWGLEPPPRRPRAPVEARGIRYQGGRSDVTRRNTPAGQHGWPTVAYIHGALRRPIALGGGCSLRHAAAHRAGGDRCDHHYLLPLDAVPHGGEAFTHEVAGGDAWFRSCLLGAEGDEGEEESSGDVPRSILEGRPCSAPEVVARAGRGSTAPCPVVWLGRPRASPRAIMDGRPANRGSHLSRLQLGSRGSPTGTCIRTHGPLPPGRTERSDRPPRSRGASGRPACDATQASSGSGPEDTGEAVSSTVRGLTARSGRREDRGCITSGQGHEEDTTTTRATCNGKEGGFRTTSDDGTTNRSQLSCHHRDDGRDEARDTGGSVPMQRCGGRAIRSALCSSTEGSVAASPSIGTVIISAPCRRTTGHTHLAAPPPLPPSSSGGDWTEEASGIGPRQANCAAVFDAVVAPPSFVVQATAMLHTSLVVAIVCVCVWWHGVQGGGRREAACRRPASRGGFTLHQPRRRAGCGRCLRRHSTILGPCQWQP